MKYTYKITFEIESNIVPKFVEYALQEVLEETKISIIQGQPQELQHVPIVEVKKRRSGA